MEIIFQNTKLFALKSKPSRKKSFKKNKFLGVRQRPSGKWVAEIKNTTQKLRMWLGTFDTAEEAARAYDEAAFLLRGSSTRRNFVDNCSPDSHISMKVKSLFNQKKASKQNLTFNTTNYSTKTTKKTNSQTSSHVLPIGFNQGFNMIHEQLLNYNFSFQLPKPVMETSITTSSQTNNFQSYSGDTSPTTFEYSYQDLQMFFQLPKPVIETTSSHTSTTTRSHTNIFQSYSGDTNPTTSEYPYQDLQTFDDDAYKPDLIHCLGNEENTVSSFKFGQVFGDEFYQLLSTKEEFLVPKSEDLLPEFKHMMVERQISASLYAINGVNEYWENFNNFNDSLSDLPMVSQMFCST